MYLTTVFSEGLENHSYVFLVQVLGDPIKNNLKANMVGSFGEK